MLVEKYNVQISKYILSFFYIQDEQSKIQDDLTCEFCEHLIEHVKDLVTTNTTMVGL